MERQGEEERRRDERKGDEGREERKDKSSESYTG